MTLRYAVGVMRGQPLREGYQISDYQGEKVARWPNGAMAKFYDDESVASADPPEGDPPKPSTAAPHDPPVTHEQAVELANYVFSQTRKQQRQTLIDTLDQMDWTKLVPPPPPPPPVAPETSQAAPEKPGFHYIHHKNEWHLWPVLSFFREQREIALSWLDRAVSYRFID